MLPFTHTLLPLLLPFVAASRREMGVGQDMRLSSAKGHADGAPPFIAGTSGEASDSLPKLMVQELKEAAGTSKVQEAWSQSQDVKKTASELQEVRKSKEPDIIEVHTEGGECPSGYEPMSLQDCQAGPRPNGIPWPGLEYKGSQHGQCLNYNWPGKGCFRRSSSTTGAALANDYVKYSTCPSGRGQTNIFSYSAFYGLCTRKPSSLRPKMYR